ncbi:hypothetical protein S245_063926, partial [Arachis hypogaea]
PQQPHLLPLPPTAASPLFQGSLRLRRRQPLVRRRSSSALTLTTRRSSTVRSTLRSPQGSTRRCSRRDSLERWIAVSGLVARV